MGYLQILILLCLPFCSFSVHKEPVRDSLKTSDQYITKSKLVGLIDSLFEKEEVSIREIDQLNYYASLLHHGRCDSIRISDFNLHELSFYSRKDENLLFPQVPLDSISGSFNLILENEFLSYYSAPFKGVVTSHYGWRDGRMHKGIDIDLNKGDRVTAAFSGKVRFARKQGGFGNVIILMHPNGLETVYAHLWKIKVKEGDVVMSGQLIGLGGSTGHSTGSHLHFEMRYKGHSINPASIISFSDFKPFHKSITIKNTKHNLCAFPSNSSLHTVIRGESWNLIASKYGLSTRELLALNGVSKRYYLKPGQHLRIH